MHAPPPAPHTPQPHRLLTAVALAHHLGGTHSGAGWRAPCPAHADPGQALSLIESKDQHGFPCTLLSCQADCTLEALCAALHITPSDLLAVPQEPVVLQLRVAHALYEMAQMFAPDGTPVDGAVFRATQFWDTLPLATQLDYILTDVYPGEWCTDDHILATFSAVWDDARQRGRIHTAARARGIFPPDLGAALRAWQATQSPATAPEQPALTIINAEPLRHKMLPPAQDVIADLLPAGNTLLVGRAKDGKSLMAYNLAVAVATGGKALGHLPVRQGRVLYLALEDGERRAQKRLQAQVDGTETPAVDLSALDLVLWEAPRIGEGLEEALLAWVEQHADARLIIIDILEKVRPPRSKTQDTYGESYQATARLTRLAQERNLALLLVHHTNKATVVDARDSVSGPMSLLGGADTLWSLHRGLGEAESTLKITGRDVPEQELALQFVEGHWTLLGDAADYRRSQTRQEILTYLHDCAQPQAPNQLADALGRQGAAMRQCLRRMVEAGEVIRQSDGRYRARPVARVTPAPQSPSAFPVTAVSGHPDVLSPSAGRGTARSDRPLCPPQHSPGTSGPLGSTGIDGRAVPDVTAVTPVTPVTPVTSVTARPQEISSVRPLPEVIPSQGYPSAPLLVPAADHRAGIPLSVGRAAPPPDHASHRTPGTAQSGVTPVTDITSVTDVTSVTGVAPVPAAPPGTAMEQADPRVSHEATAHRATVSPACAVPAAPPPVPPAEETVPTLADEARGLHTGAARADPQGPRATLRDGPDTGEEYEEFLL